MDHEENGTESPNWRWSNPEKADAQFSERRGHSRRTHTSKGGGKLSIHNCADIETIETVFRTSISVNHLSFYGAVSDLCDECESCHDRTGGTRCERQSGRLLVPSVIKTNILLNDDPAQEEYPLQRYRERSEKLSQQDRLSKFYCRPQLKSDSISWRKTLKNSHNSQIQWHVVSTLGHETKNHLNRKVGFVGTPRLDPYWKLQLVAYKVKMEWKSQLSLWTKTNLICGSEFLIAWKLVTNLNWKDEDDNEQETS